MQELTNTNNINAYKEIVEIRKFLKGISQLSWDMNNLEKRYPLDKVPEDDLFDILDIYRDLRDRLVELAQVANSEGVI